MGEHEGRGTRNAYFRGEGRKRTGHPQGARISQRATHVVDGVMPGTQGGELHKLGRQIVRKRGA
jgi:hypothetical protein